MNTLDALGEQGESIDRMQFAADRMHGALDESEKKLREMESGFGFFRKKDRAKSRAARSKVRGARKRPGRGRAAVPVTAPLRRPPPPSTPTSTCAAHCSRRPTTSRTGAGGGSSWWKTASCTGRRRRRRCATRGAARRARPRRRLVASRRGRLPQDKGRPPRGFIDLSSAHIRLTSREVSGRDYSFEIGTKERSYQFAAEGQRACRAWYTSLSQHMILFGGSTDMEGVVAASAAQGVHRRAHEGSGGGGGGSAGAAAASAGSGAGSAQPGMAHLISEDNVPLKARATEMDKDLREISVVTGDLDGASPPPRSAALGVGGEEVTPPVPAMQVWRARWGQRSTARTRLLAAWQGMWRRSTRAWRSRLGACAGWTAEPRGQSELVPLCVCVCPAPASRYM